MQCEYDHTDLGFILTTELEIKTGQRNSEILKLNSISDRDIYIKLC